jgi:hypothetical protein
MRGKRREGKNRRREKEIGWDERKEKKEGVGDQQRQKRDEKREIKEG